MSADSVSEECASGSVTTDTDRFQLIDRAAFTRITNGLSTSASVKRGRSSLMKGQNVPDVRQEACGDECDIYQVYSLL